MSYADLTEETTIATDLAIIDLLGAVSGLRTFAQGFSVGATGIEVIVKDAAGNFEAGKFTLATSTRLMRTSILRSSNSNNAVAFPAGTKTVRHAVTADSAAKLIPIDAAAITVVADTAASKLVVIDGGVARTMTFDAFFAAFGQGVAQLGNAAALSGSDLMTVVQAGVEVQTTLAAIAAKVAIINATPGSAPGATLTATSSIVGGAATGGGTGNAPGATLTGTSSIVGGVATGGGAPATTITPYTGGNTFKASVSRAAAANTYATQKQFAAGAMMTTPATYWNFSPVVTGAKCGWGTSNVTPPADLTTIGQNQQGDTSINGMRVMSSATSPSWVNDCLFWVPASTDSGPWYFWIKPTGDIAQCMNPAGLMVVA